MGGLGCKAACTTLEGTELSPVRYPKYCSLYVHIYIPRPRDLAYESKRGPKQGMPLYRQPWVMTSVPFGLLVTKTT